MINSFSIHGLIASPYKSAYISARHGLEGFSKVVALEGGPKGVTSNSICPVYVRTPLVESQIADQARAHNISEDEVVERIMLIEPAIKRLVEPEEVAELAHFLCTPPGVVYHRRLPYHGRRGDRALALVDHSCRGQRPQRRERT